MKLKFMSFACMLASMVLFPLFAFGGMLTLVVIASAAESLRALSGIAAHVLRLKPTY